MVKIFVPGYSKRLRGWLGKDFYARTGVVENPYPLGVQPSNLASGMYYNRLGWCYQVRRTWHGMQNVAMRPPLGHNPNTPAQQAQREKFAKAVAAWQALSEAEKDHWRSLIYPNDQSGYNKFLSDYLTSN